MIEWILLAFFIGLILFPLRKRIQGTLNPAIFSIGLVLKVLAGLSVGWIFSEIYVSGDTFRYFKLASQLLDNYTIDQILFNASTIDIVNQTRTLFFIRFLSTVLLISNGSYWIAGVYFSIFGFLASWYFVKILIKNFPAQKNVIIISILFIPSVLFWSSGIQKGTLILSVLMILTAQTITLYRRQKLTITETIIGVISGVILFRLSHYGFIAIILFSGSIAATNYFSKQNGILKWSIALLLVIVTLVATQSVHPYLTLSRLPQTLYENNVAIAANETDSSMGILLKEPSWSEVIRKIPLALMTGLTRPSFFDETPLIGMVHKIENLILLSLICFSTILAIQNKWKIDLVLIGPAVLSILILATFLPLSTPNLGTLVRYKNVFIPFLFLISSVLPYNYLRSDKE